MLLLPFPKDFELTNRESSLIRTKLHVNITSPLIENVRTLVAMGTYGWLERQEMT